MSVEIEDRDARPGHRSWTAHLDGRGGHLALACVLYEPHAKRPVHMVNLTLESREVHAGMWLRSREELVAARDVLAAAVDAWPEGAV